MCCGCLNFFRVFVLKIVSFICNSKTFKENFNVNMNIVELGLKPGTNKKIIINCLADPILLLKAISNFHNPSLYNIFCVCNFNTPCNSIIYP